MGARPRSTPCSPPSIASSPMARTELVLVSGYAGIGKSSLVNELHKALVPPRGLFAAGKFDQYKRDIPYATLAQAFQSLVRQILGKSDSEMSAVAVGPAGGPRPERPAHGQSDSGACPHHRRAAAGCRSAAAGPPESLPAGVPAFPRRVRAGRSIRSRCSSTICNGSIRRPSICIEHLVTHPEVRHLLLIGAYRDNEVGFRASRWRECWRRFARRGPRRRGEVAGDPAGAAPGRGCGAVADGCAAYGAGRARHPWPSWCSRRPPAIRSSRSSSSPRWPKRRC